jgi:hypothetical protein
MLDPTVLSSFVKIENGKIVAGAIIPVSEAPANTRWTLTAFPTQGMSDNSLVVTIPAKPQLNWLVVSKKKIFKISTNQNTLWDHWVVLY